MNQFVKCVCAMVAAAALCGLLAAQSAPPDEANQKRLKHTCGGCHPVDLVTSQHLSREEWRATIEKMMDKGLDAPEDELEWAFDYLSANYGPKKSGPAAEAKLNINKATAAQIASVLGLSASDAHAVIKYREANGQFKNWQDLKKVPGIDLKKLEASKDRLEF